MAGSQCTWAQLISPTVCSQPYTAVKSRGVEAGDLLPSGMSCRWETQSTHDQAIFSRPFTCGTGNVILRPATSQLCNLSGEEVQAAEQALRQISAT